MKHLNENNIKDYISKFYDINTFPFDIFVETGTYKGDTIFPMGQIFNTCYTIEISQNAIDFCMRKIKKRKVNGDNITFLLGPSEIKLIDVINIIKNSTLSVFFLDAHVTVSDKTTEYRTECNIDVPLCLELDIISKNYHNECFIIIDDTINLGKTKSEETAFADWTNITEETIKKSLNNRSYELLYTEDNDRILIKLNKMNEIK